MTNDVTDLLARDLRGFLNTIGQLVGINILVDFKRLLSIFDGMAPAESVLPFWYLR
jgi:hypothetical protein